MQLIHIIRRIIITIDDHQVFNPSRYLMQILRNR